MRALVIVDVQNDFLPGGALAVPDGEQVIPLINRLQPCFELIAATQDWHPANHGSFAANHPGKKPAQQIDLEGLPQTLWPVHCVQNTWGAEFALALERERIARVFRKGTEPEIDSYSGFYDNGRRKSTGLSEWLKERGVSEVFVCGLATDYCVKFTAVDAVQEGFTTYVIEDACRGVGLQPEDVASALKAIEAADATLINSAQIIHPVPVGAENVKGQPSARS